MYFFWIIFLFTVIFSDFYWGLFNNVGCWVFGVWCWVLGVAQSHLKVGTEYH